MTGANAEFVQQLARMFPDLAPLLSQHIVESHGILPHIFMGDVTRYVLSGGQNRRQIVEHLDRSLGAKGGDDVQNLIAVSFVENIGPDEHLLEKALEGVNGENIRNEWHAQYD